MRIRKLASKVLGTQSSQQHSSPPPPATYGMIHDYVCELNRSPWDVFPFAPLADASDDDDPLPEEVEEQESAMADDGIKEEDQPMSAITSHSSSSTAELMLKEEEPAATDHETEAMYEEMYMECKPKKKKANKGRKTATTTTTAAKREEYIESTAYTCKKTDGKQWRCRLPVDQPNSLCHYHLDQLRSYRCCTNSTRKARRAAPAVKTAAAGSCNRIWRKRPRTPAVAASGGSDSNDMYYYSAFGPWRGKQRGGEPATVAHTVKDENEEQQLECHRSSRYNDDDQDESDEDSLEDSEEESKTEKLSSRKKKRRPVKARSLKSLL